MPTQSDNQAAVPGLTEANMFVLSGGCIEVTFTTTSITSDPRLNYRDREQVRNFSGEDISIVEVPNLGSVATVTLAPDADAGSTTFSLVVPKVLLQIGGEAPVTTFAVTSVHTVFRIPSANEGQRDTYEVIRLEGTASLVAF
jgi:hypothetical protein